MNKNENDDGDTTSGSDSNLDDNELCKLLPKQTKVFWWKKKS